MHVHACTEINLMRFLHTCFCMHACSQAAHVWGFCLLIDVNLTTICKIFDPFKRNDQLVCELNRSTYVSPGRLVRSLNPRPASYPHPTHALLMYVLNHQLLHRIKSQCSTWGTPCMAYIARTDMLACMHPHVREYTPLFPVNITRPRSMS